MSKYNSDTLNSNSAQIAGSIIEEEGISLDQLFMMREENELIKQLYGDLEQAELMLEESNNILTEQVKKLSHELTDAEIALTASHAKLEQTLLDLEAAQDASESDKELVEEYKIQLIRLSADIDEQTELLEKLETDNEAKVAEFNRLNELSESLLNELDDQKLLTESLKETYANNISNIQEEYQLEKKELTDALSNYRLNFEKTDKQLADLSIEFEEIRRDYTHYEKITNDKIDEHQKLIRTLEEDLGNAQQEKFRIQDEIYELEKSHATDEAYQQKIKDLSNEHKNDVQELTDNFDSKARNFEARIDDLHLALKASEDMNQIINDKLHENNVQNQKLLDKLAHKEELIAKFEIDNKELAHALKIRDNEALDFKYDNDRIKAEHRNNIDELKNKIHENDKRILALESIKNDLELKLQKNKKQAIEERDQLKIIIDDQCNEINNLDKENFSLAESLEEIKSNAKYESKKQYENFQNEITEIRDSHNQIQHNLQSKYDELFSNFSSVKQTDDKLKLKLEKQDKIINDFERKFNAKNIEIEKLELERASFQDQLLQLQKFEVKSKLEFNEISAQLHDQQEQQYVTEQANNKLSKDLRLHKTEIQKLNQKLQSKIAKIDKLELKNAKLIAEIDNLKS